MQEKTVALKTKGDGFTSMHRVSPSCYVSVSINDTPPAECCTKHKLLQQS
uniref:Uncharacterized protein n=1 Tax=Arion vulgaris TaxID=1028688 RepID=A0A0B7A8E6_9EUPU